MFKGVSGFDYSKLDASGESDDICSTIREAFLGGTTKLMVHCCVITHKKEIADVKEQWVKNDEDKDKDKDTDKEKEEEESPYQYDGRDVSTCTPWGNS